MLLLRRSVNLRSFFLKKSFILYSQLFHKYKLPPEAGSSSHNPDKLVSLNPKSFKLLLTMLTSCPCNMHQTEQSGFPRLQRAPICKLQFRTIMFEVVGKDSSQSLICNITDMAIITPWQYRVMGGSDLWPRPMNTFSLGQCSVIYSWQHYGFWSRRLGHIGHWVRQSLTTQDTVHFYSHSTLWRYLEYIHCYWFMERN